jgi:hypothetical protein
MNRAKAVDKLTAPVFFAEDSTVDREKDRSGSRLRAGLRLTVGDARVESALRIRITTLTHVNVHHFEQDIAGRLYQVEVTSVGDRWRAQLRRAAGMPTAMMPFYGATPEEAARQLTQWITLAHRRQPAKPIQPTTV